MENHSLTQLHPFTSQLLYQMQRLGLSQNDQSLVLADALLVYAMVEPHMRSLPPQIVVIGPTQSGKSTVANLLLGGEFAIPSPLAGYTRHAQGFSTHELSDAHLANIDSLLPWLQRSMDGSLSDEKLTEFTLRSVTMPPDGIADMTVWDTPDFDSVSSRGYRDTVPQVCAMADAIIMVVSREKYADQSVWNLLSILAPTGKPIALLVNKLQEKNRQALLEAVGEKLQGYGLENIHLASLVQLELETPEHLYSDPAAIAVREELRHWATSQPRVSHTTQLAGFMRQHWAEWISPIEQELDAKEQWQTEVELAITELKARYQSEYIDSTDHSDALQRAMARLLELLEVPAVAGTLGRLRTVVTWPARQVGKFIKVQKKDALPPSDLEQETLQRLTEHAMLRLMQKAGDMRNRSDEQAEHWWQAMEARLKKQRADILEQGERSILDHQTHFEPEVEAAAQSLYTHLQDHPATLNGLRAARISTDAAAVVLAVKSAGLGVADLIFAPAMLAFSSMLTEGAVGQYMKNIESELRETQLESMETRVSAPLMQTLLHLGEELRADSLLGIQREELQSAREVLEHWA